MSGIDDAKAAAARAEWLGADEVEGVSTPEDRERVYAQLEAGPGDLSSLTPEEAEGVRIVAGAGGGGLALVSEAAALALDEERVKREAFERVVAREMLAYSRWRDFSVSAREQVHRDQAAVSPPYQWHLPPKLPYPRWPHGVL